MEILKDINCKLSDVTLILGFFDGIHLGHRSVIKSAIEFANKNNSKTLLITFPKSPAETFGKDFKYIYPRAISYEIIKNLGVDYLYEIEFEDVINIPAETYLENNLVKQFRPKAIFTGFNHTFGANKQGNPELLSSKQKELNYEYFCIEPYIFEKDVISSTYIKELIGKGDVEKANRLLDNNFCLKSTVIHGQKLGTELGFPTANLKYPENIIKLPYGVYAVKVENHASIMNWGKKPTIGTEISETMEVHILNFNKDLYGKTLDIEVLKKIRDEQKFNNLEELKKQIAKDIEECLKL